MAKLIPLTFKSLLAAAAFLFLLLSVILGDHHVLAQLNRESFPEGFIFGSASSSYQYEGAWNQEGKGPSIWDTFTAEYPEKIADGSSGKVADEFYYRFQDDIKLMKDSGIDAFRFSISWPRLLPDGKVSRGVNQMGIQAYNKLIDALIANGIKPVATLFHWDTPQALEDEYGGFLSPQSIDDFRDYAALCFSEFGDRIKYWLTLNEPNIYSAKGYAKGQWAPGRCSSYIGNCTGGDSATEPYIVTHNLLLSHAMAVKLYRETYQDSQAGMIGIAISCDWRVPYNDTSYNLMAASRAFDFLSGWILDPINFGKYPETMRSLVGDRLPEFTLEESEMLKHSFDFLGINYYTTSYAQDDNSSSILTGLSYTTDSRTTSVVEKDGIPIGEPTQVSWLYIYPKGLQYLLDYVKEKYNNPSVIITENGMGDCYNYTLPLEPYLQDHQRIRYLSLHLSYLHKTIKNGADVKGYLVWSFLDNFEWSDGYTYRFGMYFVDYQNRLKRYPKDSAFWFKNFLKRSEFDHDKPQDKHSSI